MSWRKPGRVSSSVRVPPPGVFPDSSTSTDLPASASVIAAASPFGPAPTTTASGVIERPDQDVLARREVQQRILAGRLDTRRWHRVLLDLGDRRLQRPGRVMDLAALEPAGVDRVEAVAFCQEVRERAWVGFELVLVRPVAPVESLGTSLAFVREPPAAPVRVHVGAVVRQLVAVARRQHGELAR